MSGAAYDLEVSEPEVHVKNFLTGIRKVNCATEADTEISKEVIECLEELPAEKVDSINELIEKANPMGKCTRVSGCTPENI